MIVSNDQLLEAFILFYMDNIALVDAAVLVTGRKEISIFDLEEDIKRMRNGWVQMNMNIRNLRKEKKGEK